MPKQQPTVRRKTDSAAVLDPDEFLLTQQEQIFIEHLTILGTSKTQALKAAGLGTKDAEQLLSRPRVQLAIITSHEHVQGKLNLDRERVLQGMLEAIELAKLQADPKTMIQGWKEVAVVMGYSNHAKKVEVSASGTIGLKDVSQLTNEQLLQLAQGTVIDGISEVIGSTPAPSLLDGDPAP